MREILTLNTVDDLVAQAVIYTSERFKLVDVTNWEYEDPAAGEEWRKNRISVVGKSPGYGNEGYEEWSLRDDAYDELKPEMRPIKTWSLRNDYDTKYHLSPELGEQLDAVWTKRQSRYYRDTMERTGLLTLAGMLKRLGRTDISQKIHDAETARKNREAIYRRNNLRKNLNSKLSELEKWVNDYGAEIGVTVEMFQPPAELAFKLEEESL